MISQENKELLLRDLCGKLPYGVKMNHIADNEHSPKTLIGIAKDMITLVGLGGYECVDVEHYKPYLFPLSSMTAEQLYELRELFGFEIEFLNGFIDLSSRSTLEYLEMIAIIEWFNKNHFDINGLIPMGLAIDCTNLNIY